MEDCESFSDLHTDLDRPSDLHGSGRQFLPESLPLHIVHDNEHLSFMFLNRLDGADVRVGQRRGGPRFKDRAGAIDF